MAGKNMNYFLMDSTPNGRIKCTLANWTGVAYKIPRVKLVDCKYIDYLEFSMEQKMQNSGMTVKANCKRSSEGYIVLQGSTINSKTNEKTCSGIAKKARERAKVDENNILLEDVLFLSPSAASMFVTGASSNGYTAWKTAEGKTLKEVETSEAEEL